MQYMQALQNHAAACMKQCLSHWPSGKYIATEHLDDGTKLQVHIESTPEYMNIDFEGSGQTHTGNMNATPAIVRSVVMYVLRVLAGHLLPDEDLPLNEGLLQNVQIHLPDNSILNPRFNTLPELCPAVVGGNTETSQRLTDTLLKALKLMACSQGTMNNLIFGNSYFGYYETIGGGSGAGNGFHGFSGVHHHMTNTRITDPELMEYRYPVQVLYFGIRHNSGGKGHYNGGNGLRRELQFLAPVALSVLTQHRNNPPYGMAGGEPGSVGTQYIKKTSGAIIDLASIDSAEAEAGDILVMLTPGGGGYGHP
jgi:5-oxoprolinase (ATP-hydrolysing)